MSEQPVVLPTAHYIFKEIIHVRVPYLQMRSVEDIEFFGVPDSGNDRFNRQTVNEHQDIMIPISQMVEYYKTGAQIFFPLASDIKRVYEYITNHLNAWKRHIAQSLNVAGAPIEDLKLLDEFANAIYDHAKYQFTDEIISSLVSSSAKAQRIGSILGAVRTAVEVKPKEPPTGKNVRIISDPADRLLAATRSAPEPEEQKFAERESITDFLDERTQAGFNSLNGPYDNQPSNNSARQGVTRDGLSYQSLLRKGRSWR